LGLISGDSETPSDSSSGVEALMEHEVTPPVAEGPAPVEAFDLGGPPAEPELQHEDLGMLEMELPGHDRAVGPEQLGVVEGPEVAEYDLSLDVTEVEEQLAAPAATEVTVAGTGMDALEMPIEAPSSQSEPMAEASYAPPELDLSGIDLDLGEPGTGAEAPGLAAMPETPSFDAAAPTEVTAEAAMEIDPEVWEETNTKLDLARAYLEMGDHEGAREILQEVLSDGDSRQRAEAQKLLSEVA
ncbi:MAG: FimV/HubP family polar landmark protein, partial [Thiobacillaceae bacterium]